MNNAVATKVSTLSIARANVEAAFASYSRTMQIYQDTNTESVELPENMWDASEAELIAYHPVFRLLYLRRDAMERARNRWLAAVEAAKEQTEFSF